MLTSQLFWRVLGVYAALTVGTAVAFVAIMSARQRAVLHEQVERSLQSQATVVQALVQSEAATIAERGLSLELDALLTRVAKAGSSHTTIVADNDRVIWDSQLSGTNVAREVRSHELTYSLPIDPRDEQTAVIRVSQPIERLTQQLAVLDYRLWGAAATIGMVALAVTYLVVGRIIGPLETLTQAAQQMASGELPKEVQIHSHNEIGTLADAFNSMSRQLSARIHDLQEQRQNLEHSHARIETVLGAMFEGVMAVDADERILFANNAAITLLDLNPATMVGRPIWEAVRHPELEELMQQALSGEHPPRLEFDVSRTKSTVAVTVSALPGQPAPGAVMVLHDVTELRRLEHLRRTFVQNVSHELKTPLSAITAYADTLLEGGLEDEDCNRMFVERIAEQADRLHTLILDLLALARMESEEHAFEVSPTDVSRIVTASVDTHQGVASAKRIALVMQGPAEPLYGLADDDGLRSILDNLLDNAINYTPVGGRVIVRWRQSGEVLTIEVEDTGTGIAKEHQQRIFERFYRIDKARSRELGGTGLGLAIVKHLCQVFGGAVQVKSQLGQGSTFTVRLKAAEQFAAV